MNIGQAAAATGVFVFVVRFDILVSPVYQCDNTGPNMFGGVYA